MPKKVGNDIFFINILAANEEGLYRLSGASSVITALRQKFEEGTQYSNMILTLLRG